MVMYAPTKITLPRVNAPADVGGRCVTLSAISYGVTSLFTLVDMCVLQAWVPRRQFDDLRLSDRLFRRSPAQDRMGDYENLPTSAS